MNALNDFFDVVVSNTVKHGGVTADVNSYSILSPQNVWYFPKYPSKTVIIPATSDLKSEILQFIEKYWQLLMANDCVFGVWLKPKTNQYYIDINTFTRLESDALSLAEKNSKAEGRSIVSIYNPQQNKTVYLNSN
jgi:hypothetical protein